MIDVGVVHDQTFPISSPGARLNAPRCGPMPQTRMTIAPAQRRSLRSVSCVGVELDRGMGTITPTHALNANTANAAAISFRCFMTISRLWLAPIKSDTA
jgi:hypothetical protein